MTDKQAENKAVEILLQKGCTAVGNLNTIDQYSTYDISGLTDEKIPFVAEVKNRDIPHDQYGDVFCDEEKIRKFQKDDNYQKMLVFNFYSDGYYAVANPIKDGYTVQRRKCPRTTRFGNQGTEWQLTASMKQKHLKKYTTESTGFKLVMN